MSVINHNPYNVEGAAFDVRDTLTPKLKEFYDRGFEHIAKYDSEREWDLMLKIRTKHKRIRLGIWTEIKRLVRHGKKTFSISRALDGLDNPGNFYRMCKNPEICGYFFTRPFDHNMEAQLLLNDSLDNIREIQKLSPICERTGKPHPSIINAHLKIFEKLQDRVLGQTVQRIQQHTVQERKEPKAETIAEIDEELKKLEASVEQSEVFLDAQLED